MPTNSDGGFVFVSYRHGHEAEFALRLASDLKNAGLRVWADRLDGIKIGVDWRASIERAINTCTAMIPILTPDYLESPYCRNELARADDLQKPTFPIVLRPISPTAWPLSIQRVQYEDFTGWRDATTYRDRFNALRLRLIDARCVGIGAPVDRQTKYLNKLIAEIEAKRGVLQYIELGLEAGSLAQRRPEPAAEDEWGYIWLSPDIQTEQKSIESQARVASQHRIASLEEAASRFTQFVLVGEPGAGKTTALRRLVRKAALRRLENPTAAALPILIDLSTWIDHTTFGEFVQARWPFNDDATDPLRTGDVWLCLDGLNEMGADAETKAKQIRTWVKSPNRPSQVIITCRT